MPDTFREHYVIGNRWSSDDTRRELLRQARDRLERADRHERWDCSARDYCSQAADLLRRAGLPSLAADCEDEFGCDVAAALAEIERECGR